jgi:hypothetical protein
MVRRGCKLITKPYTFLTARLPYDHPEDGTVDDEPRSGGVADFS